MKEMFLRSEELFGVRHGNQIEDGDSKTFEGSPDLSPYGMIFVKNKYIGRLQKRMSTRRRKTKQTITWEEKVNLLKL